MTSRIFWIYRLVLAHREELLVETLRHGEAQRYEVPAQHFTKADGAAKPDAGLPPFGHGSAYPFAIEADIARIDQNMQANMGCRLLRFHLVQSLLVTFVRGVATIDFRARSTGALGQILHSVKQMRDAYT